MIRNRSVALLAACVFVTLLAACSSDSSSNGDKAAFCKTNSEISAGLSSITSADQAVAAFKTVQDKFDALVKNAPSEVKSDTQLLVDAARKAISTNDASAFQTDAKLQAAGTKVDTFCGQSSGSSSSAASSASSASGGDKAAFCAANGEINAQVNAATSADQLVTAFKAVQGKFDAYIQDAPTEVKGDAQLLVGAARTSISTNDPSPFFSDTSLQAASAKVDTFCGQSSSSSSASSSSSSSG